MDECDVFYVNITNVAENHASAKIFKSKMYFMLYDGKLISEMFRVVDRIFLFV